MLINLNYYKEYDDSIKNNRIMEVPRSSQFRGILSSTGINNNSCKNLILIEFLKYFVYVYLFVFCIHVGYKFHSICIYTI